MRLLPISVTAGLVFVVASACGGDDGTIVDHDPTTTTTTTTTTLAPTDDLPALPQDPDAAFVTIDVEGIPAITADGRVFDRAPAAQGFTAALPLNQAIGPLVTAQLTPAGLQAVVAEADELGLLQTPPDYGDPGISDSGYLDVVLTTADGVYEHHVYAPGEETGDRDADAARDRLDEFVSFVGSLSQHVGDELGPWSPYVPERWVVDTAPYVESSDARAWPFATDPVDGCATFPSAADDDTASGVYTVESPGGVERTVEVSPALPFTEC